jgi:hypothetical protein
MQALSTVRPPLEHIADVDHKGVLNRRRGNPLAVAAQPRASVNQMSVTWRLVGNYRLLSVCFFKSFTLTLKWSIRLPSADLQTAVCVLLQDGQQPAQQEVQEQSTNREYKNGQCVTVYP